ncbi:MAG: hypothetical protein A2007_05265 [Verrucomicrobia bacterium GWC2_42_7]|nr:MAG: hypothetical protein A2007_05265 [Verrucomicrobia bacterium GWC2_42_7]
MGCGFPSFLGKLLLVPQKRFPKPLSEKEIIARIINSLRSLLYTQKFLFRMFFEGFVVVNCIKQPSSWGAQVR